MILNGNSMTNFSVYVKDISLTPTSEKTMRVRTKLLVKRKGPPGKTGMGDLSAREIMLVMTTSDDMASSLYKDRNKLLGLMAIPSVADEDTQIKIISLSQFISGIKNLDDYIEITNLAGTPCLNLSLDVDFSVPLEPSSLDLFVMSYKSTGPPAEFFHRGGPPAGTVIVNNIVTERIIDDGSVNNSSTFFLLNNQTPEKSLWLGTPHQQPGGRWYTGRYRSRSVANRWPLEPLEVFNTKIKDLRSIKNLQEIKFSLQKQVFDLHRRSENQSELRKQSINNIQDNSHNYLSDILYSKGTGNKLSYYFSINYLEMLRRNALYADLYSSTSELLTSCDVKSIKILRRRVKKANLHNKLTGGGDPNRLFDNTVDIIEDSQHSILDLDLPNPGVLNMVGADPEMDDITFGLYEYGVEMEIVDNSSQKLINIANALTKATISLEAILKRAVLENNYNAMTDSFNSSFIAQLHDIEGKPWNTCAYIYGDAMTSLLGAQNKFNSTGVGEVVLNLSKIGNPELYGFEGPQFLIKLAQNLVHSINLLVDNNSHKLQNTSSETVQVSNSQLGKKIRIFKVQQFFQQPFDADWLTNHGLDFFNINEGSDTAGSAMGIISYPRWDEILNNQQEKSGASFAKPNTIFLTPNFININSQSTKIYSKTKADSDNLDDAVFKLIRATMMKNSPLLFDNSATSLNSEETNLTNKQIITIQNQIDMMNYNDCELLLFDSSLDTTQFPSLDEHCSVSQNSDLNELVDSSKMVGDSAPFASAESLITEKGNSDPEGMLLQTSPAFSNMTSLINRSNSLVTNYLLENDFFNGAPSAATNNLKGLRCGNILESKDLTISDYEKILNDRADKRTPTAAGTSFLGSVFPLASNATKTNTPASEAEMVNILKTEEYEPQNLASFAMRYGFINRVEYLAGYQLSAGGTRLSSLVKSPIWRTLTYDKSLSARPRPLVCRLKPYSTYLSDFKGLSVDNYNEIFILGIPSPVPLPTSTPDVKGGTYQSFLIEANEYSDVKEYSISYNKLVRVRNRTISPQTFVGTNARMNRSLRKGLLPLKGNTSYDVGHKHEYIIDSAGNGVAKEWCLPDQSNVCHSHKIIKGVVQPANSKDISSAGVPTHTHNLSRRPRPGSQQEEASRSRTMRSTGRARSVTPRGGGGRGSSGGGY